MPAGQDGSTAGGARVRWRPDPVLGVVLGAVVALAVSLDLFSAPYLAHLVTYWGIQVLLDLLMVITCRRVTALAGDDAPVARFWRWLAWTTALFLVGDLWATVRAATGSRQDPLGGGTGHTLLIGLGIVVMVVVTLTHPAELNGAQRRRMWLDATTMMAGAGACVWYLQAGQVSLGSLALGTAALVSVFGVVRLSISARPPFTRGATLLGLTGVVLTGVSTSLTPSTLADDHLGLILLVRLLPSVAIALTPRVQELQLRSDPGALLRVRRPYSLIPYAAVGICQVLLILVAGFSGWSSAGWGVIVGGVIVTSLVVVRQLDAFRENASLLARLDESLLRLRRTEQRFRSLIQQSSDITVIVEADGTVGYASPALNVVLGIDPDAARGRSLVDLFGADAQGPWLDPPRPSAEGPDHSIHRVRVRHPDGTARWLEVTVTDLRTDPSVRGIVCNARDVTEAQRLQERLHHQASHDELTQLSNRAAFDEQVRQARTETFPTAVLVIDLNGFKPVNDTYGHHVGDALLVHVAERIRGCVRPTDTVARVGGDEFAVLLRGATEQQAVTAARRLTQALRQPVAVDGQNIQVSASVGIAAGLTDELEALLKRADAAMYVAKRSGADGGYRSAGDSDSPASVPDAARARR